MCAYWMISFICDDKSQSSDYLTGWYWLEREVREFSGNLKMSYVLICLIITQIYTSVKISVAVHLRFVHWLYVSYTLKKRKPFMQWQPQNGSLSDRIVEDARWSGHSILGLCNYLRCLNEPWGNNSYPPGPYLPRYTRMAYSFSP